MRRFLSEIARGVSASNVSVACMSQTYRQVAFASALTPLRQPTEIAGRPSMPATISFEFKAYQPIRIELSA